MYQTSYSFNVGIFALIFYFSINQKGAMW